MNNGNDPSLSYGDRLVAYMPLVRKLANRYCRKHSGNGPVEDFVQDVLELALKREANYDASYTFGTWMHYLCGWIAADRFTKRKTAAGRAFHVEFDAKYSGSCEPRQFEYAELSQVLRLLSGRDGEVVLRTAMGEELALIGADLGVSKERVRQLKVRGRQQLSAALAEVA